MDGSMWSYGGRHARRKPDGNPVTGEGYDPPEPPWKTRKPRPDILLPATAPFADGNTSTPTTATPSATASPGGHLLTESSPTSGSPSSSVTTFHPHTECSASLMANLDGANPPQCPQVPLRELPPSCLTDEPPEPTSQWQRGDALSPATDPGMPVKGMACGGGEDVIARVDVDEPLRPEDRPAAGVASSDAHQQLAQMWFTTKKTGRVPPGGFSTRLW